MKDHSLLVERYRSKTLSEYVGNEHIKKQIQKYLDQDDIQNFIFYGYKLERVKLLLLNSLLIIWTATIYTLTLATNGVLKLLGTKSPISQVLLRLNRSKLLSLMKLISLQFKRKHH